MAMMIIIVGSILYVGLSIALSIWAHRQYSKK